MSEEHRHGMLEFAEKIGHLNGTVEQVLERMKILVDLAKDADKKIDDLRASIPPNHLENHTIIDKKIMAANDYAAFWHDMRCLIATAVSTKTRLAITFLLFGAILMIAGSKGTAQWFVDNAKTLLGFN